MSGYIIIAQLVDGASSHTAALFENAKITSDTPREQQLLLNQYQGHLGLAVEFDEDVSDLVNDVGLNTFSGLVQDEQFWLEDKRPPDSQLLLLTARKVSATPPKHLLQDREQVENLCWDSPPAVPPRRKADL